jgi:F-type H+-transporting ATPase subunit gamma
MRVYAGRMREMVRRQQASAASLGVDLVTLSPFLQPHPETRRVLLLHISGDRGMCGAYNSAIDRLAVAFVTDHLAQGVEVDAIAKGLKGSKTLHRRTKANVVESAGWLRAGVTADEVDGLYDRLSRAFLDGEADEVWCSYTRFFSPMRRYPTVVRLLPLSFESAEIGEVGEGGGETPRWFYEPDLATVVTELLGIFLRLQIEDVLLESYASEQGARMITMEEATERADRSLQELTVAYNRLRREAITSDLIGVLFASALREDERAVGAGEA